MVVDFIKMEALGNDFIMIDAAEELLEQVVPSVAKMCDRCFGIGGDGVIFILPAQEPDNHYRMRIFNSDGSEAEMCGNGIRCFAKYVIEKKGCSAANITVETMAGVKQIQWEKSLYRVDMGAPILTSKNIPVDTNLPETVKYPISIGKEKFSFTAVSMGNPHAVIHVDSITDHLVDYIGPAIEKHPLFPNKTNVEFIKVLSDSEVEMRVWERGCGETLACGTGTCAAVVAGILTQKHGKSVTVHLLGGDLAIEWSGKKEDSVFMTGSANVAFTGSITL